MILVRSWDHHILPFTCSSILPGMKDLASKQYLGVAYDFNLAVNDTGLRKGM